MVVYSPQIVENFRRSSASGLSLTFVVVWLLGDVFNILGALLQGVIPTMTILAVYYIAADIVLLGQCFYYRGFTQLVTNEEQQQQALEEEDMTEDSPLLWRETSTDANYRPRVVPKHAVVVAPEIIAVNHVDTTHLSPTVPLIPATSPTVSNPPALTLMSVFYNTAALLLVCMVGIVGWFLSPSSHKGHNPPYAPSIPPIIALRESIRLDIWGQIFGYFCAVLYLASRVPQILLNYRRKSTEGLSILFFVFACVGNVTYILSILAYKPSCARTEGGGGGGGGARGKGVCEKGEWGREYGRYVLVNASWIVGSAGTLLLDLAIFGQFWLYRSKKSAEGT